MGYTKQLKFNTLHLFIFFIICSNNLFSWGFKAHKSINQKSIIFLPKEIILFYKKYNLFIKEHAPDADKRKHFQKNEKYNHFINLDLYGNYPFNNVPQKYKKAIQKFGEEQVLANGLLPYNILKVCDQLTKAFKEKNGYKILKISADLGHYIGDASVPLHITKNYNGQLTNQEGIHSLWETQCVHLINLDTIKFKIISSIYLKNINEEIWKFILESFKLKDLVLDTEKEVSANFNENNKYSIKTSKNKTKKNYSKEFIEKYLAKNNKIILQQMYKASYLLSCLYYTCWVNAGQPDLNNIVPKGVNKFEISEDEDDNIHEQ